MPMFWHQLDVKTTKALFHFFGALQIILALCINVTVLPKRIIYHYEVVWDKKIKEDYNKKNNL